MSNNIQRPVIASALTAIFAQGAALPAQAAEPVVQGPESVQDWYNNGQRFIHQSRHLRAEHRHAKNVILFVGDGMGISTLTAARILEGQLNAKPGEENRLSFFFFNYLAIS